MAAACTTSGPSSGTSFGEPADVDGALAAELLTRAAEEGENDLVRFALASGANIDAQDPENGKTPLILAAERGHVRTVALLIENGAGIDTTSAEQWTPLVYAAARGQPDVARLLIGAGADIEVREPSGGYTPLMIAALLGQTSLISPLVEAGADVNARSDQGGAGALAVAAASSGERNLVTMAELLVAGSNLNAQDDDGATPLMGAVRASNADAVNLLLSSGADATIADFNGETALDIAQQEGMEAISRQITESVGKGET
ncbi:MAG: ankyrin repeat domain-containing protein [Pseudomonadota bacterium]